MTLEFPSRYPGGFAGRVGDRFRDDELICAANEIIRPGDDAIVVPAESHENARAFISAISASASELGNSFSLRASAAPIAGRFAEGIYRARKAYLDDIAALRDLWIAEGREVTPKVAERFVVARSVAKDLSRAESPVPSMVYKVLDKIREEMPRSRWTPSEKIFWGEPGSAIASSFKTNRIANALALKVARPAASMLRVGSVVVVAADISDSAVRIYNATEKEEQQAALEALGRSAGAGVGIAVGGFLCTAMTLTTGGLGFLGCSIITGASGFVFEQIGGSVLGGSLATSIAARLRSN